jgi:predicted dehydrogenase
VSSPEPVGVGIIGAGVISSQYLGNMSEYPDLKIVSICDAMPERAAQQAEKFGVGRAGSISELLRNDEIEIVLNLTPPSMHAEVGLDILAAGKHVFSEKPLALEREQGRQLLDAAESAGLRVACAPDTFLAEGFQAVKRATASGAFGKAVRAFTRFESPGPQIWHPDPEFLFRRGAGPLFDMGPYYITALVQLFGSISKVSAIASAAYQTRTIGKGPKAGTRFDVEVPTHVSALFEFADGGTAESTYSFDSQFRRFQFEVMCEDALIQVADPNTFASDFACQRGDASETVVGSNRLSGRGVGVVDLARSLHDGSDHRASGALAYHVLDVMTATMEAADQGRVVTVASVAPTARGLPAGWSPFDAAIGR